MFFKKPYNFLKKLISLISLTDIVLVLLNYFLEGVHKKSPCYARTKVKRLIRIELTSSAWKAEVIPLYDRRREHPSHRPLCFGFIYILNIIIIVK